MMNLELLFVSAELTGNTTLSDIAIAHATTTMNNHIRSDGSTWHVVEYSATTGLVNNRRTAQGYSDSSTWARGQAWAVNGFANSKLSNNLSTIDASQSQCTSARRMRTS